MIKVRRLIPVVCLAVLCLAAAPAVGQELFSKLIGDVQVQPVEKGDVITVPFITWGGDVPTFHANGGLETKSGSGTIFEKLGLKVKLVNGDDFPKQVKDYLGGKTPLLRGTFGMLSQASQVVNSNPATKSVVFLQLTWSAGDHIVARDDCKTLADLKGKKVAIQKGGPHSEMLADTLASAGLTWADIEPVWVEGLTGDTGPAAKFRKDPTVAACTVISPDKTALVGGEALDSVGSGTKDSVKGARVLNSTAWMTRSICDVYACRKDFYDTKEGKEFVRKFAAGYIKACEELLAEKALYEKKQSAPKYSADLRMAQEIFGKEAVPTLDDAHGLISDCNMVLFPGNEQFFNDRRFMVGFDRKQKKVLDIAQAIKSITERVEFVKPEKDFYDFVSLSGLLQPQGGLTVQKATGSAGLSDIQRVLHSFSITFDPNEPGFTVERYVQDFQLAIDQAAVCGGAAIVIRGHTDPTLVVRAFLEEGLADGSIRRALESGKAVYYYNEKVIDLHKTAEVLKAIKEGKFPRATELVRGAITLSQSRADSVKEALEKHAESKQLDLQENQFTSVGVGISEPVFAVPKKWEEAKQNMRVEFRLQTFPPEAKPTF